MNKNLLILALGAGIVAMPASADISAYWKDSYGSVVKTPYGCVRTINWTTEKATAECGGKVVARVMDSDNDGVDDSQDQCPATARGARVDSSGCELDSDNDGVVDSMDKCPATARGAQVDSNGCELDSDKDGVVDSKDRCPGTASGSEVDANGCAVTRDSDADGIADNVDACPGTPPGTAVDTSGCELKEDIRLNDVNFKSGTAELDAASRDILDNIASVLKKNQHLSFEVAGHTDNTGNYNYNVQLSQQRAESVRQYLINQGVAANRLTARGYGPDRPIASNETREGRSQNRRVVLVLQ